MSLLPKTNGFTMVELLVTLVLLGLVASVVAPGLESWLSSRQAASVRMAIAGEVAMLPLRANRSGKPIVISQYSQLQLDSEVLSENVVISQPINVLANGYCLGGQFILSQSNGDVTYDVMSPYCQVARREIQ